MGALPKTQDEARRDRDTDYVWERVLTLSDRCFLYAARITSGVCLIDKPKPQP